MRYPPGVTTSHPIQSDFGCTIELFSPQPHILRYCTPGIVVSPTGAQATRRIGMCPPHTPADIRRVVDRSTGPLLQRRLGQWHRQNRCRRKLFPGGRPQGPPPPGNHLVDDQLERMSQLGVTLRGVPAR